MLAPGYPHLMDAETIRLVAAASGAVVAGLLGALIAGAYNRSTTRETIVASSKSEADRWERERDLEQIQWHRNQKYAVYEQFLSAVENYRDSSKSDVARLQIVRSKIKMIGSVPVRRATAKVANRLSELRDFNLEKTPLPSNSISAVRGRGQLEQRLQDAIDGYVNVARLDLGTATPEDEQLRESNLARRARTAGSAQASQRDITSGDEH